MEERSSFCACVAISRSRLRAARVLRRAVWVRWRDGRSCAGSGSEGAGASGLVVVVGGA